MSRHLYLFKHAVLLGEKKVSERAAKPAATIAQTPKGTPSKAHSMKDTLADRFSRLFETRRRCNTPCSKRTGRVPKVGPDYVTALASHLPQADPRTGGHAET